MIYSQLVLVEYRNVEPFVYHLESRDMIDIQNVAKYFTFHENFNEERDSITFIDYVSTINIDTLEV
tara:strand:+ start:474 stop:671 length:198 start_codon:yes stop_codon:yes gene_type:complete